MWAVLPVFVLFYVYDVVISWVLFVGGRLLCGWFVCLFVCCCLCVWVVSVLCLSVQLFVGVSVVCVFVWCCCNCPPFCGCVFVFWYSVSPFFVGVCVISLCLLMLFCG